MAAMQRQAMQRQAMQRQAMQRQAMQRQAMQRQAMQRQRAGWDRARQIGAIAIGLALAGGIVPSRGEAQLASSLSTSNPPMFTDLRLGPRFIPDPTRLRGLSGGDFPTEQLAGRLQTETGTCLGFVSEQPDHNLELTAFFDYLNIQVLSAQDTVMLIKGPGGTWCSDNRSIAGASVAGQWLPGRYGIWVGSADGGNYAPYSIEITEVR